MYLNASSAVVNPGNPRGTEPRGTEPRGRAYNSGWLQNKQ